MLYKLNDGNIIKSESNLTKTAFQQNITSRVDIRPGTLYVKRINWIFHYAKKLHHISSSLED